ncbi:MAG: Inositol 2-dehydrogenase/D-chiro-inositol 3-dehydrogenase [Candidatus Hydrogenedentes bacterium ADurb.Bin179]|nr:MAG: Inositol 2-dehydrogenase/D-chiro-inositol 3-dehydrogenase [Candidatus Hydrogenedentes bacterium ADurb.Bin179]
MNLSTPSGKIQGKQTLSRRTFMEGAASATTVALLSPGTALGTNANNSIKAGIIGLGGRGRMIASMVRDHGGLQITAVADYFQELAEGAGAQFNVPKEQCYSGLSGYQGLIASGVEAVFLETPPYCFPEHAMAATEAGLHVFMAKPVACDVPGCTRINEAGARAGAKERVFLVDFQTRTDPFNIEVIRQLHEGAVGPAALLAAIYTDEGFADPPRTENAESRLRNLVWVNDDDLGGGYLVNAGIHALDVALWMADALPVSATGGSRRTRNDPHGNSHDIYSLTYEFEDGLLLNHRGEHLPNRHGFTCGCTAFCRDGYAEAAYEGEARLHLKEGEGPGGAIHGLYEQGARRNIAAFHEQIREGRHDNSTVTPSVNATLAALLGREACLRRGTFTWVEMMAENKRIEPDLGGLRK